MDTTPNLRLPYLMAAQAQKHVTHNEAIRALDALVQLSVSSRTLAAPPPTPTDGQRFIVAASPTGAWAGYSNAIAAWQDGAWAIFAPNEGWVAWINDEDKLVAWNGSSWVSFGGASVNPAALVGVNTSADTTNRLAVKSNAALFSHDDVTPGTGDMRVVYNKKAAANTASFLFQDGFSGRAEVGLTGDDNLHVKVSADGTTWFEALIIDRTTGIVTLPLTASRTVLTAARTYYVRTDGNDSNTGLTNSAGGAFKTVTKALSTAFSKLDLNGFDVTIQIVAGSYAENLSVTSPQVGAGRIILSGDTTTPANCTIAASGEGLYVKGAGTRVYVSGIKVTAGGFAALHADAGGQIEQLGRLEIGAVGGHQFVAEGTGKIYATGAIIISGGCAGAHLLSTNNGFIYTQGASWTITGTPTVGAFAQAGTGGVIYTFSNTFSGALNGQRYNASLNGVIQSNTGGNVNYFPGSGAGSTSTGGQYS